MSGIAMVVRRHVSADVSEEEIQEALRKTDNSPVPAILLINDSRRISVKKILTNTGVRISTHIEQADSEGLEDDHLVRNSKPNIHVDEENDGAVLNKTIDPSKMTFDEFLQATGTQVMETQDFLKSQMKAKTVKETQVAKTNSESNAIVSMNDGPKEFVEDKSVDGSKAIVVVKEEPYMGVENLENKVSVKEEPIDETKAIVVYKEPHFGVETKAKVPVKEEPVYQSKAIVVVKEEPLVGVQNNIPVKEETVGYHSNQPKLYDDYQAMHENFLKRKRETPSLLKPSNVKKERVENQSALIVSVEDGDFAEEPDWYLVGRTAVSALSTSKGRKLVDNEIVHFSFPSPNSRFNSQWIVRFSTMRFGEIGRLPMEWGKCVVPLVHSGKVKVLGRCIVAPTCLSMMQEIMLYVSFYIHHSIFTEGDKSSWRLDVSVNINATIYPLLTLFKLLKIKPYLKAEFTPEELDSRKRRLNLDGDSNETLSALPAIKQRNGCSQVPEQNKDEQAISESSLNKLVGAAEVYDLEEMEPPNTLTCDLRPYQKQALYWMSELEKGFDAERASKTLHPCWAAYRICDERASSIYVNIFSGEATTQLPTATQMARGGILADAMGLGKTVMTIALILTKPGRKSSQKKNSPIDGAYKPKGGTLVVCPLSLLSQWKEELETHSKTDTLSIFVHYGGGKANDSTVISDHDVVLTTYGVLTSAYKYDREESIFHRVDWYRVVLDEAHTIKSWKSLAAQAAYSLSSHCRWCLTGTPLQNNLEDLYSLLCFLHVEPWCNWAWWSKLIQRPYENGDSRGLKLIKAILRPMMLRRTKETRDKEGRPIIILPPTDVQIIECQQSEAERDFYDALFKRSKVQFDQFVAQGKVLHNYANILELLLRLRQCCDHPYLVMSRGDNQKYADLNKLARRFLEINPDSTSSNNNGPSAAYIEEVVDGIRRGENTECPICMESADDPVLTPCAHRMCRECLLSSWRSPATGLCPICRQVIKKTELITCPSESRFQIDIEKSWKESSKVLKLMECLELVHYRGSDEKSIIFSQFTAFMDLLEIPLKNKRIGFLRFDGTLSQKNREKVLKEFSENRGVKVLLMSLRAGGVGLNLTAASNVFLMDPWWNPAVEEQAIMRIHRIGQKRTVRVRRFIVKDSVEERLQQVQARKQRMIAGALTDEEVRSARIEELKMLFR